MVLSTEISVFRLQPATSKQFLFKYFTLGSSNQQPTAAATEPNKKNETVNETYELTMTANNVETPEKKIVIAFSKNVIMLNKCELTKANESVKCVLRWRNNRKNDAENKSDKAHTVNEDEGEGDDDFKNEKKERRRVNGRVKCLARNGIQLSVKIQKKKPNCLHAQQTRKKRVRSIWLSPIENAKGEEENKKLSSDYY